MGKTTKKFRTFDDGLGDREEYRRERRSFKDYMSELNEEEDALDEILDFQSEHSLNKDEDVDGDTLQKYMVK